MTHVPSGSSAGNRVVRRVVAATVLAESIVVVGYGFVLGIDTLVGSPVSRAGSAFLALLVVLLGAGVAAVGVGVWRGQRWSRAPALVWQVLQTAVAAPALESRPQVGVPLFVASVLVVVGLFVPGVLEDPADGSSPVSRG